MSSYRTIVKVVKTAEGREVPYVEVLTGLTYALDLSQGQHAGHVLRTCWIGMHIGRTLQLSDDQLWELYYTLLLKDMGCSQNCSRIFELFHNDDFVVQKEFRLLNYRRPREVFRFLNEHAGIFEGMFGQLSRIFSLMIQGKTLLEEVYKTKGEAGAKFAEALDFSENIRSAIKAVDEHYDGKGYPNGLEGDAIPLYARIAAVAQLADALSVAKSVQEVVAEIEGRADIWFDSKIVDAFRKVSADKTVWDALQEESLREKVIALEPADKKIILTEDMLDVLIEVFAKVIDGKSIYTEGHSQRVAEYAEAIGKLDEMDMPSLRKLKRAGWLHDIGKLGVSNAIIDKPARLNDNEINLVHKHAIYSEEILARISIFKDLAIVVGAHHERLDGLGYPNGKKEESISIDTRIITVADIYDGLTTTRPHRERMGNPKAFEVLNGMRNGAVEGKFVDLLRKNVE